MNRLAVIAAVLLSIVALAGCSPSPGFIPASVYSEVAASDRERNYDLAWQEIAQLEGLIERGEDGPVADLSLFVTARMDRLNKGEPRRMEDRRSLALRDELLAKIGEGQASSDDDMALKLVQQLRSAFDDGDFSAATAHAMEIHLRFRMESSQ